MALITRAIPAFSSANADESITAMFAGPAAGLVWGATVAGIVVLVCVCTRIANVVSAIRAAIRRNTFIALLLDCFGDWPGMPYCSDNLPFCQSPIELGRRQSKLL